MLVNLAVNARDAMADGGTLVIETRRVEEAGAARSAVSPHTSGRSHVCITVTDSGSGMDTATRERIFEPFFTTKELGRGTGLGLATVYGIVTQLGGSISVESAPGLGTTFSLSFPSAGDGVALTSRAPANRGQAVGREHILLVEDDDAVRALTRDILVRHGYQVTALAEPREAVQTALEIETPFDLIVTDVVMPGLTGPALVRRVQAQRPITGVYMSGYAAADVMQQINEDEIFLPKPFTSEEILGAVRRALDNSRNGQPVATDSR